MAPRPDESLLSEVNPFLVISSSEAKEKEEEVKEKDEKEQILDAIGSKFEVCVN